MVAAIEVYKEEVEGLKNLNVELCENSEHLENTALHLNDTIKSVYIVLNADRENALKVNGMDTLLEKLGEYVMSSSSIKMGVINEGKK